MSLSAKSCVLAAFLAAMTCFTSDAFTFTARNVKIGHPSTVFLATKESHDNTMSRRRVLDAIVVGSTICSIPSPAMAAYGDSSNMKGFDYIDYLVEKNAVADSSKFVYKGADRNVQLKRISDAAASLQQIPDICRAKKWSQVNGILTGPLGTLIQTMNQIMTGTDLTRQDFGSAPPVNKEQKAASQKVKADLYAIGQAAMKKSEVDCIQATEAALQDLEAFVKVAF